MNPRLKLLPAAALGLLALSCSDPAPTPAAVGLTLGVHAPGTGIPGTLCPVTTTKTIGNPAPTAASPGIRVTDGKGGVDVSCAVKGKTAFSVSASISLGNQVRFNISGGTIDPATKAGTFNASLYTPDSSSMSSETDVPCTFDISTQGQEVKAGTLYATYRCPAVWDRSTATPTACQADGFIVLEYCNE